MIRNAALLLFAFAAGCNESAPSAAAANALPASETREQGATTADGPADEESQLQQPASTPVARPAPSVPTAAVDGERGVLIAPLELSLEQARGILASIEPLAPYAASFEPFALSDVDAALRRGERSRDSISAWTFAPPLSLWRPSEDTAFQILSGRVAQDRALLAVVRASASGYEHVASTTLEGKESTIAIGYREGAGKELLFTSCYGCPGESGALRYDSDQNVTLEFR